MAEKVYSVSERDYRRLQTMLRWYESVGKNLTQQLRRRGGISDGGGAVTHKAYAKAAAGAGTTIVCYLDTDATGEEITVNCEIAGGSALNAASPLLAAHDMICVWNDDGTWRPKQTFDNTGEC